ncbi:TetR/AcrR family transcriptional regulator [Leptospira interrogans]
MLINVDTVRESILGRGIAAASKYGLKSLSLSEMARDFSLPRSQLFGIFPSNDALQLGVLDHAAALFSQEVIEAAPLAPAGEERITALFMKWLNWSRSPRLNSGCPFVHASAEGDELPEEVKRRLTQILDQWSEVLRNAAAEAKAVGAMRSDVDADQFVFELYGLYLSHHFWHWSMKDANARTRTIKAFERLLASTRPS